MTSSPQQPNYFVLKLNEVPRGSLDLVTSVGFELGAAGSEEDLQFTQKSLAYDAEPVETPFTTIKFYFETAPDLTGFETLRSHCRTLTFVEESGKDWMEEWKKNFEPTQLSGPYWVVPSWKPVPAQCERPIFIDPGMAFGTGTHETTQLASELVREAMKLKPKASFVDIGSGTGILSIVANKEGASKIFANDIDPEARRVARENFAKNELDPLWVTDLSANEIPGKFDIVTANILDHVLIQLGESLKNLKSEDGFLVLSGILDVHEQDFVRDFFLEHQLQIHKRISRNEWVAFLAGGGPSGSSTPPPAVS